MRQHWAMGIVSCFFGILCLVSIVALSFLIMALPLLMTSVLKISLSFNTEATILLLWDGLLLLIGVAIRKKIKKRW